MKKKDVVVEEKQAEQKVFQTHRAFVSHRVPCQLLSHFSRPPSLPTVHLFPYAVWPRPLSYTPPQSKRPIRVLISAHGVSRLKKKILFWKDELT